MSAHQALPAMLPDRFAVLSDIHGNLLALDAILADIAARGIRVEDTGAVFNLGDHLQGPLDPIGTAERLMPLGLPSIRGNCDRWLFEAGTIVTAGSTLAANRASISPQHQQWLAAMPQTRRIGDALLCHGTPWADDVYLLETVTPSGARLKHSDEIAPIVTGLDTTGLDTTGLDTSLILCGHSHLSRTVQLPGGPLIVNPGSVGLPAYTEDSPHPHAMESGSPHARYAVLERAGSRWTVEHRAVAYDWHAAARMAAANGRPDWAAWLSMGRV